MLFIQSNSLTHTLREGERVRLLDALAERGWAPLVRAARRGIFRALAGARDAGGVEAAAAELERVCAARAGSGGEAAYAPGDLFCDGDCVLALVFGEGEAGLSASVVYDLDTASPLARLERFCRDAADALSALREGERDPSSSTSEPPTESERESSTEREPSTESEHERSTGSEPSTASGSLAGPRRGLPPWRPKGRGAQRGLALFTAIQPAAFARAGAAMRGGRALASASELLERREVRDFLRRVEELRREGYTPRRVLAEAGALGQVSVEGLMGAGLLERELRVSCRKTGHALFDLPSPDSLAAVTLSRAKCSLCAAPVADEVVEETFSPTPLAVALLEDGGWLANRIYRIVRSLGVAESDITTGPPTPHGESYLAADVCGSSFLFVTRDGDLTPAFSRRVAELAGETEATHLVVVVTGAAEDEGRLRLYEFAWRRARDGKDLSATVVEGLDTARAQVGRAFESAARRELSRALFTLDAALGFTAAGFVLEWFKTAKSHDAASANGAAERAPAAVLTS